MPLSDLAAHRFDPSDGLDMTETAMLAVANNPDLKLARDDVGIARAQSFNAGLLPDPQISLAGGWPSPGPAGSSTAFSYGMAFDFMSLVQRADAKAAADATLAKTDLGLLWQEWQTVAQARQLFAKVRLQDRIAPLLREQKELAEQRYGSQVAALRQHNETADAVTAAQTAMADARRQWQDAERQRLQTRHDLAALLGVAPDTPLVLVDGAASPIADSGEVDAALVDLPRRRPDLLALRAGYESQDAKYRQAILAQFPSLSIGFVRQRDTSYVYTSGFQIAFNLPLFNANRGNIAIEKATRERLRDEYQIRLNQAAEAVARSRDETTILQHQLEDALAGKDSLDHAADTAQRALTAHDIPMSTYIDARTAALTRSIELATLAENLQEQQIALSTLLGNVVPPARLPPSLIESSTNAH
jgi:outer membrane protein TolC